MKDIQISQETYTRLEQLATGFSDTPDSVISRLLDGLDNKPERKPELVFFPEDEEQFKQLLINNKFAEITYYLKDGSRNVQIWNAKRFSESSNLKANLWSGQLREWKSKGITRAELYIFPPKEDADNQAKYTICRAVSSNLNIPFRELQEIKFDYDIEGYGSQATLLIKFDDQIDIEKLVHIPGFELDGKSVTIGQHELDYPLS